MNILITGASGFIGRNLIASLLESNHSITACIHKSELPFDIKIYKIDFAQMLKITDWLPLLIGIDVVINCVGIIAQNRKHSFDVMHHLAPVALFKACEKTHVKRIIQVSALGADDSAMVNYHKSKKHADVYLRSCSLEWFVLRPSLIYGEEGKSYTFFKRLSNLPLIPLMGDGEQLIQPISINRMVAVIEKCIESKQTSKTIDVVGDKPISYKQWMQQLRSKKAAARFIKIPMNLMKFLSWLLSPLNLQLLSKDNLTMLEQNNVSDVLPLNEFMGVQKLNKESHPRECGDPESYTKLDSRFHGSDKSKENFQ
jgi:uncharacterized protein YbjT (DUF2867 family)